MTTHEIKKQVRMRLPIGLLCLAMAGCGSDSGSPTAPTPAPPNFAGTWAGSGRLQQCTGNQVVCAGSSVGATQSIEFVLAQTGTSISGTWTANAAEPRIPVSGSVASDGSLNLSGRLASFQASVDNTRLTVAGTAMSGTLTFSIVPPNQSAGTLMLELVGVVRR